MLEVRQTEIFANWFKGLKDRRAKARVQARIDRLEMGNFGDVSPVGEGVSELRIHYGPGYRVYFVQRGLVIVVLLCGCLLYTSPSPRDGLLSRMPSSA